MKQLVRVLEMSPAPSRVYAEMLNLEATYAAMPAAWEATIRRVLASK
jgi:hypothetical protein